MKKILVWVVENKLSKKKNKNNWIIGYIDTETKTLHKTIILSQHFFRKYNAIGFSVQIFKNYGSQFDNIEIFDKENYVIYKIKKYDFLRHAIYDTTEFGEQVFCPIEFFEKEKLETPCSLFFLDKK